MVRDWGRQIRRFINTKTAMFRSPEGKPIITTGPLEVLRATCMTPQATGQAQLRAMIIAHIAFMKIMRFPA